MNLNVRLASLKDKKLRAMILLSAGILMLTLFGVLVYICISRIVAAYSGLGF